MRHKTKVSHFLLVIAAMLFILTNSCKKDKDKDITNNSPTNIVTDIDGNIYHKVTIGQQVWLVENLKVTKFQDGSTIANVIGSAEWSVLATPAWCYYTNDQQYDNPYGKLYNGFAIIDKRKICPKGWHVPSDVEWTTLVNFLEPLAGGSLKESGTTHWQSPNEGATNLSGFTALPGGYRAGIGEFPYVGIANLGYIGLWWSSTDYDTDNLWIRTMSNTGTSVYSQDGFIKAGLSCRCIED
jgi:uncharacterized protein (TIGR02145 family)